jgi:hypothetical protein
MTEYKDLTPFITTIRRNCDISDASGSSIFSICGMALRLRDLNKWEQGLNPWEEENPARLLDWIDAKEQIWESIDGSQTETGFEPLPLQGKTFDPFDTTGLNRELAPLGLFYGAGYAHSLKPTFFLAEIKETRNLDNIPVMVLGKELARDLLTIPALNQDGAVIFRQDAARLFLWDQMAYLKKSGQRFLNFALRRCGLPDTGRDSRINHFESILAVQEQTYIHHETGELTDKVFAHQTFREIVSQFPHSPVELLARTVKDLLADTGPRSTLTHIIANENAAGLGFYAAFQDGLFRPLFPELRMAVEKFASDGNWEGIERARTKGFQTAEGYVRELIQLFQQGRDHGDMDRAAADINEKLVRPLTEAD